MIKQKKTYYEIKNGQRKKTRIISPHEQNLLRITTVTCSREITANSSAVVPSPKSSQQSS